MSHKLATCELRDFLYRLDRRFIIIQPILLDIIIQNRPILQHQSKLCIVYHRKIRPRTFYMIQQLKNLSDRLFVICRQKLFQNGSDMYAALFKFPAFPFIIHHLRNKPASIKIIDNKSQIFRKQIEKLLVIHILKRFCHT